MGRAKGGVRAALLREGEALLAAHGDQSNCAERVFLALRALTETDILRQSAALLTILGSGAGGPQRGRCGFRGFIRRWPWRPYLPWHLGVQPCSRAGAMPEGARSGFPTAKAGLGSSGRAGSGLSPG